MRLAPWIFAALAVVGIYRWYTTRNIDRAPGVLAAADPAQAPIDSAAVIERDGFKLLPRAEFRAAVRVLHREEYTRDGLARLVSTDFAVGWGPMSDSAVLAGIEISQGNRFYFWRTETWPLSRQEIEEHSANWHVIPENDAVRGVLSKLRVGSLVELRGRLVDIEGPDSSQRTSLTRSDTGAGACEILLAASARVLSP
jgi:hypothetical protein